MLPGAAQGVETVNPCHDAAALGESAVAVECCGDVDPGVVDAEAGGPDDGVDGAGGSVGVVGFGSVDPRCSWSEGYAVASEFLAGGSDDARCRRAVAGSSQMMEMTPTHTGDR